MAKPTLRPRFSIAAPLDVLECRVRVFLDWDRQLYMRLRSAWHRFNHGSPAPPLPDRYAYGPQPAPLPPKAR